MVQVIHVAVIKHRRVSLQAVIQLRRFLLLSHAKEPFSGLYASVLRQAGRQAGRPARRSTVILMVAPPAASFRWQTKPNTGGPAGNEQNGLIPTLQAWGEKALPSLT